MGWVQVQKAEPSPGVPRGMARPGGRAEASQLMPVVVRDVPLALPPERKAGSSCRLRRARGANPRRRKAACPPPRITQSRAQGTLAGLQPSAQALGGGEGQSC